MTKSLISKIDSFADRYNDMAMCTDRLSYAKTTHIVNKLYQDNGLAAPQHVLFFNNPFQMVAAEYIARAKEIILSDMEEEDIRIVAFDQPWYDIGLEIIKTLPKEVVDRLVQLNDKLSKPISSVLSVFVRDAYNWVKQEAHLQETLLKFPKEIQENISVEQIAKFLLNNEEEFIFNLYQILGGFVHITTDSSHLRQILSIPTMYFLSTLPEYKDKFKRLKPSFDMMQNNGLFIGYKNICLVSEQPESIIFDHSGRLHNTDDAALSWDGYKAYFVANVRVPPHIVMEPKKITPEEIENENNQEVRRVMLERYGIERFIKDSKAVKIHQDMYGTLYRKQKSPTEAFCFVKVKNGTREPDGSYKDYIVLVPATVQTAHEGVAWTFYRTPETYHPKIRT